MDSASSGADKSDRERFTFFYATESPFSQFHPCTFKGVPLFAEDGAEHVFNCAEQWMMLNKAYLFKDYAVAQKIRTSAYNPPYVKKLGRQVKNFDLDVWKENNHRIVYEGNKFKFTQNPKLLDQLNATEGTTLVEASPSDNIYGIGLRASDPRALSRKTWQGENVLGELLTKLRKDLATTDSN